MDTVPKCTMLKAGRSRGSSPDEVDFFLIYLILPAAIWPWGRPLTEMSTRNLQKETWG
jgi:hypothetical protein